MAGEVVVRVSTDGEQRVRRMLRGLTTASRRADRDMERSGTQAERRIRQESQQTNRERRRNSRQTTRAVVDGFREEERQFDRLARRERESSRQTARQRRRGAGGRRGGGGGRGGGLSVGTVAAGAVAGGGLAALGVAASALTEVVGNLNRVTDAVASAVGRQDVAQRAVSGQEFDIELARLGNEVFGDLAAPERTREIAALREEILGAAEATRQSPGQLLGALRTLQTEFALFDFGRENLVELGNEAERTGGSVDDLARFVGNVNDQFRDTSGQDLQVRELLDITAQAGQRGALDPQSFAANFTQFAGVFRGVVDPNRQAGSEDLRNQFIALANIVRSSGARPAVAATQTRSLLAALDNPRVAEQLALATGGRRQGDRVTGGVQISQFRGEDGVLDLNSLFQELSGRQELGSFGAVRNALGDVRAASGLFQVLTRERQRRAGQDVSTFETLSALEADPTFRQEGLELVRGTGQSRARAEANIGLVEGVRNTARQETATLAEGIQERLETQGAEGEFAAAIAPLSVIARALEASPTLRGFVREQGRGDIDPATGERETFGALGAVGAAAAAALDAQSENRAGAKRAGPKDPAETPARIDDESIDRMANRMEDAVANGIARGADAVARGSGGPVTRRGG